MRVAPSSSTKVLVAALALFLAGCASGSSGGARETDSPRDNQDVLTAEDLANTVHQDLYSAIERLRPRWLRARGERTVASSNSVAVIVDGVRQMDGVEILSTIRTVATREVRYLSARDATTMYGPDLAGGAILVLTRRR